VTAGGPREVPIIAQEGEIILNRDQVAMLSRGRQTDAQPINIAVFDDREALNNWAESREGRVRIVRASRAYERERRL